MEPVSTRLVHFMPSDASDHWSKDENKMHFSCSNKWSNQSSLLHKKIPNQMETSQKDWLSNVNLYFYLTTSKYSINTKNMNIIEL